MVKNGEHVAFFDVFFPFPWVTEINLLWKEDLEF
jgi:hypothetical protein